MKRKILLLMLTLGFLGCISAQTKFRPQMLDNGFYLMPSPFKLQVRPTGTKQSHVKGQQWKNIKKSKSISPSLDDLSTHQVDFILDYDERTQKAWRIEMNGQKTNYFASNLTEGVELTKESNLFVVPADIYDIIVTFCFLDPTQEGEMPLYEMLVIHENVTIDKDTQLTFAAEEAKNHIHFQTLTIEGEPVFTGKYTVDEDGNWITIEEGNADDIFYSNKLVCQDNNNFYLNYDGNVGAIVEPYQSLNGEAMSDFWVSDVSDRFVFCSHRIILKGNKVYTSSYETQGANSDKCLANDPSKYSLFEDPFVAPLYRNEDLYQSYTFHESVLGDWGVSGYVITNTTPLAVGDICTYYIGASPDDSNVSFLPVFEPGVSIKKINVVELGPFVFEEEYYQPVLTSIPLTNTNNHAVFDNNGPGTSSVFAAGVDFGFEYIGDTGENSRIDVIRYPDWPAHPIFSYSTEQKKDNLGNSCPVFVSEPLQYEYTDYWLDEDGQLTTEKHKSTSLIFDYIGNYGEKHPKAPLDAWKEIEINGECIFSGQGEVYLDELLSDVEDASIVDATIINDSVVVDGMNGINKAKLHYILGENGDTPPTMTMLHLKDSNGDITNQFNSSDCGTLEFSAGDFNFFFTPKEWLSHSRQMPESVEVSYSPYCEDNWNELAVEELPEYYWPTMGWFYRGSLAEVTGEALNGWFDLKIRLEDAAGNWQEQVLSPAFRIDDLAYTSVASIGSDNAHEVARYSIDGKRVDANHRGVTIIRMSDGTARKELVK